MTTRQTIILFQNNGGSKDLQRQNQTNKQTKTRSQTKDRESDNIKSLPTPERGEGNYSQDCREGSDQLQRQKAAVTTPLDTPHCLATSLFFYRQLYLQFSAESTSQISHTSQITDLSNFCFPLSFQISHRKQKPSKLTQIFVTCTLNPPISSLLPSIFIQYLVCMRQALWWPLEVTMESQRPQPCPPEGHRSQTGRPRVNFYPETWFCLACMVHFKTLKNNCQH